MSDSHSSSNRLRTEHNRLLIVLAFAKELGVDAALVTGLRADVELALSAGEEGVMADLADFIDELRFSDAERAELTKRLIDAGIEPRTSTSNATERIALRCLDRGRIRTVAEYRAARTAVDSWVEAGRESADIERLNQLLADFETRRSIRES